MAKKKAQAKRPEPKRTPEKVAARKAAAKKAAPKKSGKKKSNPRRPNAHLGNDIAGLAAKRQIALDKGNIKRVGKLDKKIATKAQETPAAALPIGETFAQRDLQENIRANRPNQETTAGSRQYIENEDGTTTVKDSLSKEQQGLYDQQIAQLTAANQAFMNAFGSGQQFGQAYDFSGAPAAPITQDLASERKRIEDTLYERNMGQLDKTFDRRRAQMEQRLYETGNPPGTPGYKKAMEEFNDEYKAEEKNVRSDVVAQAGAEFERSFNIGQGARQSNIAETVLGRTQPLAELQTMQGFGGGPTMTPNFFNFQPVQYQGPQYLDYLRTGIDQSLSQEGFDVQRQGFASAEGIAAANRAAAGGGGGGGPSFSIGSAPSTVPNVPNQPNPVAGGFGQGFQQGVPLGVAGSA